MNSVCLRLTRLFCKVVKYVSYINKVYIINSSSSSSIVVVMFDKRRLLTYKLTVSYGPCRCYVRY